MKRLYEPAAYDTSIWPQSHWRRVTAPPCPALDTDLTADVAVIGAGVTGLNAALELVERFGLSVCVVDAGQPGWGASGRNGGFCCMGGTKLSDSTIIARVGRDGAKAFHDWQVRAVAGVGETLARHAIDADRGPEGEVQLAHSPRAWAAMQADAKAEQVLLGTPADLMSRADLVQAGLHGPLFHGGLRRPVGFPLHPMKYVLGLAAAAQAAGVRVAGDSPVTALTREGADWVLATPHARLRARKLLVATNGYSSDDLPGWIGGRTLPVLSSILVTRPLGAEEQQAQGWTSQAMAYDSRRLLHYFRLLPDGRFLFGMRGGVSARPEALKAIKALGRAHFDAMFPAWRDVETERFWSGLACLTGSLAPFVGAVPGTDGLFAAFGWHGNGVAAGSQSGRDVARIIGGADNPVPALLRRPPRQFPLPGLRRLWLRTAYVAYDWKDGPVRPGP
jgi:glycine/D-amino acid oxidase-like deaminating enzyme